MRDAKIWSSSTYVTLYIQWGGWLKKLGEGETEERQEAELIVRTINICGGHILSKQILSHHEYKTLSQLTNQICHNLHNSKVRYYIIQGLIY